MLQNININLAFTMKQKTIVDYKRRYYPFPLFKRHAVFYACALPRKDKITCETSNTIIIYISYVKLFKDSHILCEHNVSRFIVQVKSAPGKNMSKY